MTPETILSVAANTASAVLAAKDGDAVTAARHAIAAARDLVPHEVAVQLLTEEAVKRQNAIADALEAAKFG